MESRSTVHTSTHKHLSLLFRILTAGIVYMVLGYVYRSVVVGTSGFDAIPHGGILANALQTGCDFARNLKARFLDSAPSRYSNDVGSTSVGYHRI